MSIRKGYLYALLIAIGLLLWTEAVGHWQERPASTTALSDAADTVEVPWTSSEALYECSMKAQELGLVLDAVHTNEDVRQSSLVLSGSRDALQMCYAWLETEGRYRQILSFQLHSEDEAASQLSISVQM